MVNDRIVLDVMGGDHAPDVVLDGVVLVCNPDGELYVDPARLILVGNEELMREGLSKRDCSASVHLEDAAEVIGMDEKPGVALRAKPGASIPVGIGCVRAGKAGAFISMGNTGAVVGAATLGLGTLEGIRRPGIAITTHMTGRPVTILDMGANVVPKPAHLLHYALMGSTLASDVDGVKNPRVGLLNIGEEASKGTDLMRAAHELLSNSHLNFVGNVEAGEIFGEDVDVVVTDGFTGNVFLKTLEGLSSFMLTQVTQQLDAHQAGWGAEVLADLRHHVDYSEYGGALLLGVNGVVIIGHGRSDARAVANAIRQAARALDVDVNADIVRALALQSP
ncbi:MAG TPA: phosphate acyltransferase PlsX [Planctomycetes bacterium]|nr:phosphate acyltransferase PlsX [Planctomycetota bacterium]HIK59109.1 phosphate acyltransferase PlsX [Planctomycetota bacterium]